MYAFVHYVTQKKVLSFLFIMSLSKRKDNVYIVTFAKKIYAIKFSVVK